MPWLRRFLLVFACSLLLTHCLASSEDTKPATTTGKAARQADIDRLIRQLGSDDFSEREEARKALEGIGESALEALRKAATESADAEVRRRAADVIKVLDARLELRCFKGHTGEVNSVAFSPDGKRALSGGDDRTVRLWDLEAGKELRRFKGHTDCVFSVAFTPDGQRAISGSIDQTLRLWDVEAGKELRRFKGHGDIVAGVAFSPDGKRALSGGVDATLRLWDVETGKELRCFEGHTQIIRAVAFSPDGKRALSGGEDKTVRLWRVSPDASLPASRPTGAGGPKSK